MFVHISGLFVAVVCDRFNNRYAKKMPVVSEYLNIRKGRLMLREKKMIWAMREGERREGHDACHNLPLQGRLCKKLDVAI